MRFPVQRFTRSIVMCMMVFATPLSADVSSVQRGEVEHLLGFIRSSGCSMERNGSRHNTEEALNHIQKKYDYFRDKIKTTEDFIELSASKSTMSGKFYTVSCGSHSPVRARDWLLQELKRYRDGGKAASIDIQPLENEVT